MMNSTPSASPFKVIIDEDGSITLPKLMREEMNMIEGDRIEIQCAGCQLTMRKKPSKS
jgi:bifunctional DNA-binding transcriptional regulator/antitoxin component of YhaV-PrlF toxin-antitoxin module